MNPSGFSGVGGTDSGMASLDMDALCLWTCNLGLTYGNR